MEQVLPFLVLSAVLFSVSEGIRVIYEGMSRQWMSLIMHLVWGGALITACLILVPRKGAEGLALSHLIASAVLLLLQSVYTNRKLVPGIVKRTERLFISSVFLLGSCFLVRYFMPSDLARFAYFFLLVYSLFPILKRMRAKRS